MDMCHRPMDITQRIFSRIVSARIEITDLSYEWRGSGKASSLRHGFVRTCGSTCIAIAEGKRFRKHITASDEETPTLNMFRCWDRRW